METKTIYVSYNQAGLIQRNAGKYDCVIDELAVIGKGEAKVKITGPVEKLKVILDHAGVVVAKG